MKKIIISTIIFIFLILPIGTGGIFFVNASNKYNFSLASHLTLAKDTVYPGYKDSITKIAGVPITARSIVVMDADTGEIIYNKKPFLKTPIASITKLMSLIIFIGSGASLYDVIGVREEDADKLNQYIEIGDNVASLSFYPGDKMLVRDVVYSSVIRSANNTVSMLVRASGLSEDEFVERMNEYAKSLGMHDTHFTEATGLDPKNVSTAVDLAKLTRHAFKNGFIRRVTTLKSYDFRTIERGIYYQSSNTNNLLSMLSPTYYQVLGGKTGYLDESRYNLVTQIGNWQGKKMIVVVLGAETSAKRFWEAKQLAINAFGEIE